MVGASARYSCLHAPVETVTPPRQANIIRSYGRASAVISTDDVRLPLELEPATLGFKFVKNVGSLRLPFQLEPASPGFELVENKE